MRKNVFMIGYALCFAFLGCANNPPKNTSEAMNNTTKSVVAPVTAVVEQAKIVQEDTSRYKIEYVTFGDLAVRNPELFRQYEQKAGSQQGLAPNQVCLINFIEKATGRIINTYDVVANHPYKNLDYKLVEKESGGCYFTYEIDKIKEQDKTLLTMSMPSHLRDNKDQTLWKIRADAQIDYDDKRNATIIYRIWLYNMGNERIAEKTYFKIFNSLGIQIMDYPDAEIECGCVAVTGNGKFLAVDYYNYGYETGLGVIDTKTNKRIFLKDTNLQGCPSNLGNYITEREKVNNNDIKFLYYDFEDNMIYSKIIDRNFSTLLSKSETKITLKEVKTNRIVDFYIKKDFETSKIFEK